MGRVEDAMRRAVEERGAQAGGAAVHVPGDAEALANEPFPLELRARRTPDASVAVAEPEASVALAELELETPEAPTERVDERPSRPGRLFEHVDRRLTAKLVADPDMLSTSREQYRRLAATLHHAQVDHGIKVIMIASAVAGEGKTLTAVNLALTFSESYKRRVLLIDADLRRPSVHNIFQIDNVRGLSDGLAAVDEANFALHRISERLTVLPAGRPSSDPMAGLTSGRMRRLIAEARDESDWVIVDTPPVGLMTDANLLAAAADGVLLVIKAGSTAYQLTQRAAAAIGKEKLLGVVLNRADDRDLGGSHYYYNYYYGGREDVPDTRRRRWLSWFRRTHA